MRVLFFLLLFLSFGPTCYAGRTSQVAAFFGQDTPDDGESRTGTATLFKFSLTTKPSMIRFVTSFVGAVGSNFKQGDLGFGAQLYPLAFKSKSYVQPLLYTEGIFGVGTLNNKSRTDTGYELGAGLDVRLGKISGINLSISSRNAEETSTRLWAGWFTML